MARGKPATPVNRSLLENTIKALEAQHSFENRSKLFDSVVEKYNKVADVPITASVVYTRINQWNLSLITPKGKPGRTSGLININTGKRVPREEKISNDTTLQEWIKNLRSTAPKEQKYQKLIGRAEKGSVTACIKLKCLDCVCYVPGEVKACPVVSCSLWGIRPYQGGNANQLVLDELSGEDQDDADE